MLAMCSLSKSSSLVENLAFCSSFELFCVCLSTDRLSLLWLLTVGLTLPLLSFEAVLSADTTAAVCWTFLVRFWFSLETMTPIAKPCQVVSKFRVKRHIFSVGDSHFVFGYRLTFGMQTVEPSAQTIPFYGVRADARYPIIVVPAEANTRWNWFKVLFAKRKILADETYTRWPRKESFRPPMNWKQVRVCNYC